ncbi:MAG: anti-sigma factor [Rubrobacter sp.]
MAEDRFEKLLGPYLLGELNVEEERELERHLEECSQCRRELDRIRRADDLLRRFAASEPPAGLKEKVLAQFRGETSGRSTRWWFWTSAAALLVVAVLGVGLFRAVTDVSSPGLPLSATTLAPNAGGEVRVEKVGENLQVTLEVWRMPELEGDQYYEMWYYAEDGGRISCGTFRLRPEDHTTVNLTAPAIAAEYPEIEVTREPGDGDPRPSGEAVLEGSLSSI